MTPRLINILLFSVGILCLSSSVILSIYMYEYNSNAKTKSLDISYEGNINGWLKFKIIQIDNLLNSKELSKRFLTYFIWDEKTQNHTAIGYGRISLLNAKINYNNEDYTGNITYQDTDNNDLCSVGDIIRIKNNNMIQLPVIQFSMEAAQGVIYVGVFHIAKQDDCSF